MTEIVKPENLVVENARLAFRNFAGNAGKYNAAGRRNFVVLLNSDDAPALIEQGWNIKFLKPRDEDEEPTPYIQVAVNFENRPPRILLVTSRGKTALDEDTVSLLDWADVETADVTIRPYVWEVNGATGIKAYVKTLVVKITEDPVEMKYLDTPDTALTGLTGGGEEQPPDEIPF